MHGMHLRWALLEVLADHRGGLTTGELTTGELVRELERRGWSLEGSRPGKAVSDALRWEVRRGRVVQVGRGRYRVGRIPRTSEWRLRRDLAQLRQWREEARRRRSA